jgi:hypothetical protein
MSFISVMACCDVNFGIGSFTNGGCNYSDVCNTPSPTVSPITPILTPAPSPAPTTCEERKWYALSKGDELMCSNGYDIPFGSTGSEYYFNSLEECCDAEFGATACVYEDICVTPTPTMSTVTGEPTPKPSLKPTGSPVTPSPTLCEEKVFFFNGNVCSNEFYLADAPSYDSAIVCCNQNFGSESFMNGNCDYNDVCSTVPPTPSPITPAPTQCEARVFFFDGNICSNEFYSAESPSSNSVLDCCDQNFGSGSFMSGSCNYVDICNTLPPSP